MRYCPTCGSRFSQEVGFCPTDGAQTVELADQGPPADPLIGRVVDGRYRIEKMIGEGGMGIVYLAAHTVLGKKLALKVLRGDMAKDGDVVQRFIQEAQAATSIGHQNIIDISDFGKLPDGSAYFVMEYLAGKPLTDMIRQGGSIPMQEAIGIIRGIAAALSAAHKVGIVHRDLKPDNVFLVPRGQNPLFVKVLDFGIAKVGGAASKLTKTGMVFGTPHYMSPEQAAGQGVDQRTDIYALGVIMYEMFTGKVPFDADTFMGILSKHMFEPPVPPSQHQTMVKLGAVEDVILRALTKKPEDRYQSMDELITDLETVAQGGSVEIGRAPGITPPSNLADALEPPSRTEMRISVQDEERGSRSRAPIVVALLGVVVVLGGGIAGAVYAFGSGGTPEVPPVANPPPEPPQPDVPPQPDIPPPEPPGPGERSVEIRSTPSGAQVFVAGAIVGNTPIGIAVPATGARDVEVRLRGHQPAQVHVDGTSPAAIDVVLELAVQEVEDDHRPHMRPTMTGTETAMTTAEPTMETTMETTPDTTMGMRSGFSDVVDPWANP